MKKENVPVEFAAKALGKSALWVREAIYQGKLNIGICTESKSGRRSYYISPKLLFDLTGIEWKGDDK